MGICLRLKALVKVSMKPALIGGQSIGLYGLGWRQAYHSPRGGTKKRQSNDIERAKDAWLEYKKQKKDR